MYTTVLYTFIVLGTWQWTVVIIIYLLYFIIIV